MPAGDERKCRGCDTTFIVGPNERRRREWCSPACAERTRWKKRSPGPRPKADPYAPYRGVKYGNCTICGQLWCRPARGRDALSCWRDECIKEAKNRRARASYAADPTTGVERARLQRATRTDAERAREAQRVKAWWSQFPEATCAACGKPAGKPERKDRRQTCSNACRVELRFPDRQPKPVKIPPPIVTITCEQCGKAVDTIHAHQKYCSHRCRDRAKYKPEPPAPYRDDICHRCAKPYTTDRWWQKYCSPRCTRRAASERRNLAERLTTGEQRRVIRGEVFERDDYICQLCDYPTNPDVLVPDYEAPTIDHIIPLARGGNHTMDNVQTAHFLCNSLKSDSLAS